MSTTEGFVKYEVVIHVLRCGRWHSQKRTVKSRSRVEAERDALQSVKTAHPDGKDFKTFSIRQAYQ